MPRLYRAAALTVGILSIVVYLFLMLDLMIEWNQNTELRDSMASGAQFLIQDGVIMSGLAPLLVAVYFLLIKSDRRTNLAGFPILAFMIALHAIMVMYHAHNPPMLSLILQVGEVILAFILIGLWRKRLAAK